MNAKRLINASALLCLCLTLAPALSRADEILVIATGDAASGLLSRDQVAAIFLRKPQASQMPGGSLEPLDREERELRERFYLEVTGMTLNRVRAYWAKLVFAGRAQPPRSVAQFDLGDALATDQPMLTYVEAPHLPEGARVVYRIP